MNKVDVIPYGKQSINDDDCQAVMTALDSDYLTQGPIVRKFENALCDYTKAKAAVAVNSATSALILAYKVLGVGTQSLVWTASITFVATANAAKHLGADVDFVDIHPNSFNLCIKALEYKLKNAERTPDVVTVVHMAGTSVDMVSINRLAQTYKFKVIEDASHAVGGEYLNQKIGSCQFSDLAVFSFHPVKIITSGEGGMLLGRDERLIDKARALASHGVIRNEEITSQKGPWAYEMQDLGWNFRMTDFQAALGLSQLTRLDSFIEKRRILAENYRKELIDLPIKWQESEFLQESALHLFIIKLNDSTKRLALYNWLKSHNILTQVHYIPVHTQPFYQKQSIDYDLLAHSNDYYQACLSLPLYVDLSYEQQKRIVETLKIFSWH
jgi:UDP-4-amino-4,6-dideoxy-N-acetyl-beta-L-altrosamine transaminase